jgi:cellulase
MASCGTSCTSESFNVHSTSFFKIQEAGLLDDGTWVTEGFIANNSTWTVQVPMDIEDGYYVVRNELISLHAISDYGAELYPHYFQIQITGSNGMKKPAGVKFPGAYKMNDPELTFNQSVDTGPYVSQAWRLRKRNRADFDEQIFPGPKLYDASG